MDENLQPLPQLENNQITAKFLVLASYVKKYYKNKYVLLGSLFFLITVMSVTIFILPSQTNKKTLSFNQANQPSSKKVTPTAAPTLEPTNTITPVTTPTPIRTPTPTLDPLPGWRTYYNSSYGYNIRYPADWTVQDLGALEPKIPSYIAFNPDTASSSARSITVSASTRTLQEQKNIDGEGTPITVASTNAIKQYFKDSDGNQSTAVVVPTTNYLIILRAKTNYLTIFDQMLAALNLTQ